MTLTELRYVVALDRERHFGRAAERCFVAQPTLSVAIRKLEDQLNVQLFERQRGEVTPTQAGAAIIEQAHRVLDEADRIKAIAEASQDQLRGRMRLGAIYTVGPYLLPALVPRLIAAAPNMPLVIEENFTAVLTRQLKRNEVDAIIVAEPFSQAGIRSWALYDEPFVVAMPRNHLWVEREHIDPVELARQDLLLLGPGHCFRDHVISACPGCDQSDDEELPLAGSSLETIRHMVASGLGLTVLPQSALGTRVDPSIETRPFTGTPPTRRIVLAWREGYPREQAIETLRNAVLECALDGVSPLADAQPRES